LVAFLCAYRDFALRFLQVARETVSPFTQKFALPAVEHNPVVPHFSEENKQNFFLNDSNGMQQSCTQFLSIQGLRIRVRKTRKRWRVNGFGAKRGSETHFQKAFFLPLCKTLFVTYVKLEL
jgi:hypothetical protein